MRRLNLSLALVTLSLCALAQAPSSAKNDVIQHAKNALASSFDSRLPRVSLDYFLAYETDGAPAKWITTECGKRSADGSTDPKLNSPICVQADFDLNDGGALTIFIRVEGSQNERFGNASLVSLRVTNSTGNVREIRSLGDLPMELHRWPSTIPKDLPLPVRES